MTAVGPSTAPSSGCPSRIRPYRRGNPWAQRHNCWLMRASSDVRAGLARGLTFLGRVQRPNGSFPTYMSFDRAMQGELVPDGSVFPTALIAHSLGFVPGAVEMRDRAVDFLHGEMDGHGLWRYWSHDYPHLHNLPPDLDDTCVASAVLKCAGRKYPEN